MMKIQSTASKRLAQNSVVKINDHLDMNSTVFCGSKAPNHTIFEPLH